MAAVDRFKEKPVYEVSTNWPLVEMCRLIVERWLLVAVQLYFFRSENWPISNLYASLVLHVFFKMNVCFTSHHRARQATAYMDSKVIKCMEMKKLDFY